MLSLYYTDIIKIINTKTDKYGAITEAESEDIGARVEDYNRLTLNVNGQEVFGSILIMTDPAVNVTYGDKIRIIKKNGSDYELKDKKFEIKVIYDAAGFWKIYKEIIV